MVTFSMPGRLPGAVLSSAPAAERRATRRRLRLASLPLSLLPYLFPSLPRSPLPLPSSSFPPRRPGEEVGGPQPGGAGDGWVSIAPAPLHPPPEPSGRSETSGAGPGRRERREFSGTGSGTRARGGTGRRNRIPVRGRCAAGPGGMRSPRRGGRRPAMPQRFASF